MADNVGITPGTGATVAADDVGGILYQRVKNTFGADGVAVDVSAANPMPVYGPDFTNTGTITAADAVVAAPSGTGALLSGASTAGSLVAANCIGGDSAWNLQVTGMTAGTLYFEGSLDSTTGTDGNWVAVNARQSGVVNTILGISTTTNGVFRGNTSGMKWIRVRAVGALTGTPAIVLRISDGEGAMFLNASIPAGTNTIGSFKKAPSTTGTITSPALAVTSFTILAANTNRLGATFYNDSANVLYLGLTSAAVSTTNYTVQVPPNGYYELPNDSLGYVGQVTGIATVATGNVRVTELT